MGILVGTCGWTDTALVRSGWYPGSASTPEARLRHYASRFPIAEVDASYYALPSERNSRLWAERTPDGFTFNVKAFSLLTGHPTRPGALPPSVRATIGRAADKWNLYADDLSEHALEEVWDRFVRALAPLHKARKLGAVLLQFPPWFRPGTAAEEQLLLCRDRCVPYRVCVEFRNAGWMAEERRARTLDFLGTHDIPYVCVDMPQGHRSSLPPVAAATSRELAVVRLHGRSEKWTGGDRMERFRHRYTETELAEWVPRILSLAEGDRTVHVLLNNCCGDNAQVAAETLGEMLSA